MTIEKVHIEHIDLHNHQFFVSYLPNRERLTDSIGKVGLLHPIVLRTIDVAGGYQIVSGFQRVLSCIDLEMEEIDATVYEKNELPNSKALLLSLHQTATSRKMNLVEKSLALKKLRDIGEFDRGTLFNESMSLLGLEPNEKIFPRVMRLWELTDGIKAYIVQNEVTIGNALLFLEFSPADQEELLRLISPLKLGTNRLKEFLVFIDEIRRRDEAPVQEIIDDTMNSILAGPNISTPQKTERIRRQLKEKRFPQLASLERELQAKLKQLKLPPELSLTPPPFLEGKRVQVKFTFERVEELKKIIDKLSDISTKEELKVIVKML